jgi:hypothetical protein
MMIMKPQPDESPPFSIELLELYQAFTHATSSEERQDLARRIAATFASERDSTDVGASEEYHEFFESFESAVLKYEQQSSKLARLAVHLIGAYLTQHETQVEDLIPAVTASN